jgi:hypothetical protein
MLTARQAHFPGPVQRCASGHANRFGYLVKRQSACVCFCEGLPYELASHCRTSSTSVVSCAYNEMGSITSVLVGIAVPRFQSDGHRQQARDAWTPITRRFDLSLVKHDVNSCSDVAHFVPSAKVFNEFRKRSNECFAVVPVIQIRKRQVVFR